MATKQQNELLKAVKNDDLRQAKLLLAQGCDPNFFGAGGLTPLREAIRNHNIKMVRALVQHDADVNLAPKNMLLPLDHAQDMADVTNDDAIVAYLKSKKARSAEDMRDDDGFPVRMNERFDDGYPAKGLKKPPAKTPVKPQADPNAPKPVSFTKENLKDVFNPESWIGKLKEMDQLWEKVPQRLKKSFDFAACRDAASRETTKKILAQKGKPPKFSPPPAV